MNESETRSSQPGSLVAPDDLEIGNFYAVHSLKQNPEVPHPVAGEAFRLVAMQLPFAVGQLASLGVPVTVGTRFVTIMRVTEDFAAAQVSQPSPAKTPAVASNDSSAVPSTVERRPNMADDLKQVQWDQTTKFLGRNGYGKCSGIELFKDNAAISLVPLTSRGEPARCSVLIPVAAVPRLIAELKAVAGMADDPCDICGDSPATVGCPNGKQICQDCFDAGYDGDHFHEDNEFHDA